MNYALVFQPEARSEFDDAYKWYEDQSAGLGEKLIDRVTSLLEKICQRPAAYPITYRDVHRAVVSRFPYVIYYRVVSNQVIVISIFHGRRNPQDWQSRI